MCLRTSPKAGTSLGRKRGNQRSRERTPCIKAAGLVGTNTNEGIKPPPPAQKTRVNPPPREKQLKETIERTGTTARRINNQEFESSKLKEKDADFDRTNRAEKDSKKNAGAPQPKTEKAPEPLAKEDKTPKSNQFPEQDFKPTKPI
mmetsp:Transcript_12422/g.14222  ORF Transcript_12422/g.14222 Transcript_12422/m.14222 type:complete len:146 (-) Transcript_12422:366-803(-)